MKHQSAKGGLLVSTLFKVLTLMTAVVIICTMVYNNRPGDLNHQHRILGDDSTAQEYTIPASIYHSLSTKKARVLTAFKPEPIQNVSCVVAEFLSAFSNSEETFMDFGAALKKVKLVKIKSSDSSQISVAITMGITTRRFFGKGNETAPKVVKNGKMLKCPFLQGFLPSMCRTASPGYLYSIYLAYDYDDSYFRRRKSIAQFNELFHQVRMKHCSNHSVVLTMINCSFSGNPAWAQNAASMQAYYDNHDYIYRLNDDIVMDTFNWTDIFITSLKKMQPSLLGVVGPYSKGSYQAILTLDFVHKTHIDIFGYYYPPELPGWYCDGWITKMYDRVHRMKQVGVNVTHAPKYGTRYNPRKSLLSLQAKIIDRGENTLIRYIANRHKSDLAIENFSGVQNDAVIYIYSKEDTCDLYPVLSNIIRSKLYFPSYKQMLLMYEGDLMLCNSSQVHQRIFYKFKEQNVDIYSTADILDIEPHIIKYNITLKSRHFSSIIILPAQSILTDEQSSVLQSLINKWNP